MRARLALAVMVLTLAAPVSSAAQGEPGDFGPLALPPPESPPPGLEGAAGGEGAFGPRYVLAGIEIRGNSKTRAEVIAHELPLHPGDLISADDPRVETARFRVLGLGFFEDVRLSLRRGQTRGQVVLVVEVVERGTLILNEIFLGASEATAFWAGLDVGENNLLGHGVSLSIAGVGGTSADVPGAQAQQAYRVRLWDPDLRGLRIGLGGELRASQGSDFFRSQGRDDTAAPGDFVALDYRRIGGAVAAGFDLGHIGHVRLSHRAEWIEATLPGDRTRTLPPPDGRLAPIDFQIREGASVLSVIGVTVDFDTRSDPVLPQSGFELVADGELATRLWGSDYDYGKLTLSYDRYGRLPWRHILAIRLLGGIVIGRDAPFFEKYFVGDVNRLLPPRALGLNFSTQPSRALLGLDAIAGKRYEDIVGRAALEYAVPLWRGHRLVYGGDFFALAGLFALTSFDALDVREGAVSDALPIDLTFDVGVRLDTTIGIFTLSVANAIGRIPF